MKSDYLKKVYEKLMQVPRGKVVTYKILAEALDSRAYRAVGTAMRKNPYAPKVPCHRVVCSNGLVGNFSGNGGIKAKIKLLQEEGVEIKNNRIVNFEKILFRF